MAWLRTASILGVFLVFSTPSLSSEAFANQPQSTESSSETQFHNWIQYISGNGAKITTDDVKYDRATDLITAKNFTLSLPPTAGDSEAKDTIALKIGSLKLKAFSSTNEGTRVKSAVADDVVFSVPGQADGTPAKLSHVEISGGFVPALLDFRADPAKPVTSQIRLLRLLSKSNFDVVAAENLKLGESFSIGQIQFGQISAGHIAKAELAKMLTTLSVGGNLPADSQVPPTLSVESLALTNVDLDAYLRLFEASAYLGAGTARPWSNFIGEARLSGAKWQNGPLVLGMEAASLGPLKTRQFEENITDIFDNSARNPAYLGQNPAAAAKLTTAVRSAFSLEAGSFTGVTVRVTNQSGITNATIKGASFANLTASHLDNLQLDVLNVADARSAVELQKIGIDDLNLQNEPISVSASPTEARIPTIGRLTAQGMSMRVDQMKVAFENLDLAMSYFIGAIPTNFKATLEHVKFSVDQIAAANVKQSLIDLGYKDIDLSMKVSGAWQDSAAALAFDNIELTGADMGKLSLSGSLTGISRASFENPMNVFPQEVMAGGLQNLRITFENASLFDRFLGQVAKQNNKSVDELKRLLSANMPSIMARIASTQTRNKFTLAAVSFINNPKILQLLTTTSDVTMLKDVIASLPEPYNLPALLKLDVSANDRK